MICRQRVETREVEFQLRKMPPDLEGRWKRRRLPKRVMLISLAGPPPPALSVRVYASRHHRPAYIMIPILLIRVMTFAVIACGVLRCS